VTRHDICDRPPSLALSAAISGHGHVDAVRLKIVPGALELRQVGGVGATIASRVLTERRMQTHETKVVAARSSIHLCCRSSSIGLSLHSFVFAAGAFAGAARRT
jgi:hypothetical protein